MAIGLIYIIFARRIAGNQCAESNVMVVDILPSGLILLGLHWVGIGTFSAIANTGTFIDLLDSSRIHLMSGPMFWHNIAPCFKVGLGLTLAIVGYRMRVAQKQIEQVAASDC